MGLQLGEQELAVELFRRQLSDPKWNASFEPYWKSLPEVGTLMSKEVWDNAEHRALLQNEYMVRQLHFNKYIKALICSAVCADEEKANT